MYLLHVMSRQQKLVVIQLGRLWARAVIFWLFVGWVGMGIDFTLYRVGMLLSRLQVGVEVVISEVSIPALYRGVVTMNDCNKL